MITEHSAGIIAALEDIYAEIKHVRRELNPSDHIVRDLDIDSLAAVELVVALERRFGLDLLGDGRAAGAQTVGDLVALLREAGA
ncbi:acyl carrier protein [Actinomadura macra]|uniref:acyl carrier protein n=1 Tax=Actinomadura macra TaxID=46164 RepID=UPI0008364423|nr:acyl carrier protein [Actinomadura macra]